MYRIDNITAALTLPPADAPGVHPDGFFTRGNPTLGTDATIVDDHFLNSIQEELCYVIEQAGLTLTKGIYTQLYDAISILNQGIPYAVCTTAANSYVATLSPAPSSYLNGAFFAIKFTNGNNAAATLNLNGLGVKNIVRTDGTALKPGDLVDGMIGVFVYDGTSLQFINYNQQRVPYATSSSVPNVYIATLTPPPTAYFAGQFFTVKFTNANTQAAALNINSLGAKSIVLTDGLALHPGAIVNGMVGVLCYDGTNLQLLNPSKSNNNFTTISVHNTAGVFVAPSGVYKVLVKAWGGGGGGGGGLGAPISGGGGGAGAYAEGYVTVVPGNSYTVTIGLGGAAIAANTYLTGGNGTDTTFNSTSIVAKGGTGGSPSNGSAYAAGGLGGSKALSVGSSCMDGGDGAATTSTANIFNGTGGFSPNNTAPPTGNNFGVAFSGAANTGQGGQGGNFNSQSGTGGTGLMVIYY